TSRGREHPGEHRADRGHRPEQQHQEADPGEHRRPDRPGGAPPGPFPVVGTVPGAVTGLLGGTRRLRGVGGQLQPPEPVSGALRSHSRTVGTSGGGLLPARGRVGDNRAAPWRSAGTSAPAQPARGNAPAPAGSAQRRGHQETGPVAAGAAAPGTTSRRGSRAAPTASATRPAIGTRNITTSSTTSAL